MTHIVIHHKQELREEYMIDLIKHLLERRSLTVNMLEKIPDIHMLSRAKDSIGIDEVKEFTKTVIYKPFEEKYQIGIITDARLLTDQAQNALLKSLEDKPSTTIFILLVDNEKNLLPTILSRGVKHYVKSKEVVTDEIETPEIINKNLVEQFQTVESLSKKSREQIQDFLDSLSIYYRDNMIKSLDEPEKKEYYIECIHQIDDTKRKIKANASKKIALENLILQISTEI